MSAASAARSETLRRERYPRPGDGTQTHGRADLAGIEAEEGQSRNRGEKEKRGPCRKKRTSQCCFPQAVPLLAGLKWSSRPGCFRGGLAREEFRGETPQRQAGRPPHCLPARRKTERRRRCHGNGQEE